MALPWLDWLRFAIRRVSAFPVVTVISFQCRKTSTRHCLKAFLPSSNREALARYPRVALVEHGTGTALRCSTAKLEIRAMKSFSRRQAYGRLQSNKGWKAAVTRTCFLLYRSTVGDG